MVTVGLSLLAALCYGLGGFLGGLNSRRSSVLQMLPSVIIAGAITLTLSIPFLGAKFSAEAIKVAIILTIFGSVAYYAVYRAISIGPMGIASAIIAVTSASIPFLFGIIRGERLSNLGLTGAGLALVSILLVCKSKEDAKHPVTSKMVGIAFVAGLLAAGFSITLASAPKTSGIAVFAFSRWLQAILAIGMLIFLRKKLDFKAVNLKLTISNGVIDTLASILFLAATRTGALSLVAVISNMSPAITLAIAHFVVHERVEKHQIVGMLGACASVTMLSLS